MRLVSIASFASQLETGKSNHTINWQVWSGYSTDFFYREEKATLLSVEISDCVWQHCGFNNLKVETLKLRI